MNFNTRIGTLVVLLSVTLMSMALIQACGGKEVVVVPQPQSQPQPPTTTVQQCTENETKVITCGENTEGFRFMRCSNQKAWQEEYNSCSQQ